MRGQRVQRWRHLVIGPTLRGEERLLVDPVVVREADHALDGFLALGRSGDWR